MSSFSVKNVLRTDIVIHDLFFNSSEDITDYLSKKNPQFSYTNVPADEVTAERQIEHAMMKIPSCMKQHMIVFESGKQVFCKEYLCNCGPCLKFDFKDCHKADQQEFDDLTDV